MIFEAKPARVQVTVRTDVAALGLRLLQRRIWLLMSSIRLEQDAHKRRTYPHGR